MNIVVIGAGSMGRGIAVSCLKSKCKVSIVDTSIDALKAANAWIDSYLDKQVEKNRISAADADEFKKNIDFCDNYSNIKDTDIVIEAVTEKLEVKRLVLGEAEEKLNPDILLSNTSGLSISSIGAKLKNPEKFMGMHFFFPAQSMKLVELTKGLVTSEETFEKTEEFSKLIKKEIVVSPELPGFIVNRVLVPMQNEAAFLVMEGAKVEDVDKALKLGCNFPMGPLELADFVGIDIMLGTMEGLYQGFKDSKYRPCPLLRNMVEAGKLGRKSGEGFYKY